MPVDTIRYLRISDDKIGDAHGVTNQDAATLDLCARYGWDHNESYVDNDLSATRGRHRPAYARLIEDIQAGQIKRIVVFHLSRLWRNRRERAEGIEIMRRHGVSVHCAKGPSLDLSSAYGRGMAAMLGEIDTMEVELKAERQELAHRQRAKAGLPHAGGPRPWGYLKGGLELDQVEAVFVAGAFDRWVTGSTLGEICRWLNGMGVRTPRGNEWSTGSLRQVLANPRYAGLRGVRWLAHDERGVPVVGQSGEQRRQRYHEIVGPGAWPAIVAEEVWRAALARLQDPARALHYVGRERKYLLPGLALCATCGTPLKSAFNNGGRRSGHRSVKCPTTRHTHRYAVPIEDYVADVVCWRLDREDAHELLTPVTPGVDIAALGDEARAIRERLRQFAADEALGRRTRDEVDAARGAGMERLAEIDALVAQTGRRDVVAGFLAAGRSPRDVWERSPLAVQRRLVDTLAVVTVGSGRPGRPPKASASEPPPNVWVTWRR